MKSFPPAPPDDQQIAFLMETFDWAEVQNTAIRLGWTQKYGALLTLDDLKQEAGATLRWFCKPRRVRDWIANNHFFIYRDRKGFLCLVLSPAFKTAWMCDKLMEPKRPVEAA